MTARGSSPLARGLRDASWLTPDRIGIIPARAGFTQVAERRSRPEEDHPRSRGVYPSGLTTRYARSGSSPLARGLLTGTGTLRRRRRIIPARAGFTRCTGCTRSVGRDHPRSRGVYSGMTRKTAVRRGSSPLARGLRDEKRRVDLRQGIIPARAGFTQCPPSRGSRCRDHPRSRGVYSRCSLRMLSPHGSSPLARGLRGRRDVLRVNNRIIPARAGFTPTRRPHGRSEPDHPRSRGVYRKATRTRT